MADFLHPLLRDRRILSEVVAQLGLLIAEMQLKGFDTEAQEKEYARILLRLYGKQKRIRELGLDK